MLVRDFQAKEARFAMLARSRPKEHAELQRLAQADAEERWHFYEQLAGVERHPPGQLQDHEGGREALAEEEEVEP
jgi:pyruvate-ferredoxin/flavodoxin oxidoreductase